MSISHHRVVKTLHTIFRFAHTSHRKSQSVNLQHTSIQISKLSGLVSNLTMWASTGLLKCMSGSRTTHVFLFNTFHLILLSSILLRRSFQLGAGRYMNGTHRDESHCSRSWRRHGDVSFEACKGFMRHSRRFFQRCLDTGQGEHCLWPGPLARQEPEAWCLNTVFRHKYSIYAIQHCKYKK